MKLMDKRALITGGPSGIGLETAAEMARKGASLFITGRREGALREALGRLEALSTRVEGSARESHIPQLLWHDRVYSAESSPSN